MIGALRHQVDLLIATRKADGGGGAAHLFTVGETLWASIDRLTSTRDFAGDKRQRLRRIAVTVRFVISISLGDRLRFRDTDYEIVSIEDTDAKERRLILICEEVLV